MTERELLIRDLRMTGHICLWVGLFSLIMWLITSVIFVAPFLSLLLIVASPTWFLMAKAAKDSE